jgi:glucan phosphoethanolaminetransferase (alkaline phosphatase superfamily)
MKRSPINYLYFGGLLVFLLLLTASSIYTKENLGGSRLFFLLYATGQVFLEITLFAGLGLAIRRYLGKIPFALFIGGTFIALFLHIFDYLMDRILDLSVWSALRIFVLEESLGNFFYLLDASGISLWIWFAFFALLASLPLIGMFIYKITNRLSNKKPITIAPSSFLQAFVCIPLALLFWDFSASKVIQPDAYTAFTKSLPWKYTFLHPKNAILSLKNPLHPPLSEQAVAEVIAQNKTVLAKKPNIYLFVVESLRESSITKEIAPHLTQFKNDYSHFEQAVSNGNGSHLSWFSIFHSQFPFHWKHFQDHWKMGSPALHLLKKWGYQIRLYSSAQLNYYGMEELLFGDKLIDSRQNFHHAPPQTAADTDASALSKLQKDLAEDPRLNQGQVFIIFWDCTHFDYSWPKEWSPKFNPFAQEFAYFRAFQSQTTIQQIKNRYNNSVNYMDSLFGSFLQNLPNKEEAIVIFTGDHGEEFFEHGHLFHNSHLTKEQTHVPLYFKFGNQERKLLPRSIATQMDIFPSIIDYLSGVQDLFLEGNSLFQEAKWPYAVTARFNAGRTPYEFSIQNGKKKLIAQFGNRQDIFKAQHLRIISMSTHNDQSVFTENAEPWINQEFGPALDRLFGVAQADR